MVFEVGNHPRAEDLRISTADGDMQVVPFHRIPSLVSCRIGNELKYLSRTESKLQIENELRLRELRTVPSLEDAFGESLDWITPRDTLHYFQHSGYAKSATE